MRVLNIVSSKCRILASRERCPFLVHCEVLETGREGSDARLYANGADELGATLQEVLGLAASTKKRSSGEKVRSDHSSTFPPYHIPSELSTVRDGSVSDEEYVPKTEIRSEGDGTTISNENNAMKLLLRGGDQEEYTYSGMDDSGYLSSSPYDLVQEEQLQQLHEHLQSHQHHPHYGPPPPPPMTHPSDDRLVRLFFCNVRTIILPSLRCYLMYSLSFPPLLTVDLNLHHILLCWTESLVVLGLKHVSKYARLHPMVT